jgi:lipid A 3-O-deacylase
VLAAAVVFAALAGSAAAQTQVVDEVKFGVLAHDVALFDEHVESGADINLEALFTSPDFLGFIGSPRPHLGGSVNTAGNTSVGYFGLTWGITLLENLWASGDGVFANGSLGGALQNGYTSTAPPGRKTLGSTSLFRESLELGYRVTPALSVSAYLDHMSNANLAAQNAGLTDAGIRFGLKF